MTVVCLPQGGCGSAERRGVAPVRLLRSAGVRVAAGSGSMRDVSNPVGRGDPLEAAYLLASRCGLRPEDAYAAVSAARGTPWACPRCGSRRASPPSFWPYVATALAGALSLAYSRIVVHRGRVVARTSAVREYCDSGMVALDLPRQGRAQGNESGRPGGGEAAS